nr:ROK family protein [Alkalicoccus halolimnae]
MNGGKTVDEQNYLAFDIGGTSVKWGLLTKEGTFLQKSTFSSEGSDGKVILQKIKEVVDLYRSSLQGIAVSAPGFILPSGYIEYGGAIDAFTEFPFQEVLSRNTGLPVSIENDVNCVALAEKWLGNAQKLTDFVCITVGTGVGGALYLNNALYRGNNFRAGEAGFMVTNGLQSTMKGGDTLSTLASMTGLREKYAAYHSLDPEKVTGEMVFQAYDEKEPAAVHIVEDFYRSLAIGIFNINSFLNPQKILIGGGITSRPSFIRELQSHLSYVDNVFHAEIELCRFKNDAGMIGALAFFHSQYENHQSPSILKAKIPLDK